ncbi:hypothetical protein, partial [Corallococcus terminator]|uniref:hypothetical protein n=1 Tax=Corallococcus terminator TaxID=2316733 RepID=UPI0011C3DF59
MTPTLSISEESNYPTARDPKSPYAYRVQALGYDDLWEPANAAFAGGLPMRVSRFVIRNPYSVPMAVNLVPTGAAGWSLTESWGQVLETDADIIRNVDGLSFPYSYAWDSTGEMALNCVPKADPSLAYPCDTSGGVSATHVLGSPQRWACLPKVTSTSLVSSGVNWDTLAYLAPLSTGNEQEANRAPSGYIIASRTAWRVPAASAGSPGEVVLYVVVPRTRNGLPALDVTGGKYQHLYAYHYGTGLRGTGFCGDGDGGRYFSYNHRRKLESRVLDSVRLSATWPFAFNAVGTYDAGEGKFPALGAPRAVMS